MARAIDLALQRDAELLQAQPHEVAQLALVDAGDIRARIAGEQQRAAHVGDALDLRLARQLVAADVLHLLRLGIEVRIEQLVGHTVERIAGLARDP